MACKTFLLHHFHSESVRTVEFCKEIQYCNLFCSSGYDSKICIFNADAVLGAFPVFSQTQTKKAVKFTLQRHQQHPFQEGSILGEDETYKGFSDPQTQEYMVIDRELSNHSSICTMLNTDELFAEERMLYNHHRIHSTTFLSGNEILASARSSFVALFDITTQKCKHLFHELRGCEASERSVARKIADNIAVTVNTKGKGLVLLDTKSCSVIRQLEDIHEHAIRDVRPLNHSTLLSICKEECCIVTQDRVKYILVTIGNNVMDHL